MRFARTTATAAAAGLAAFTLASCGSNQPSEPDLTTPPVSSSVAAASTTTSTTAAPEDVTSVEAASNALTTAAGAVPDGQPFDLEVEVTDGQVQFEAKVASGGDEFKLVIDATGAEVVSQTQSETPGDDVAKLDGTTVTAAEALQTASGKDAEAQFNELEIDTDDAGTVVWEVELVGADGAKIQYDIDAHTGEVLTP